MKTKVFLTIIALFCLSATCMAKDGNRLRVGIALGGGGARGAAEVGVLKVIEEMGIPIDYKINYVLAVGYPDETPEAKPRDDSKVLFIE